MEQTSFLLRKKLGSQVIISQNMKERHSENETANLCQYYAKYFFIDYNRTIFLTFWKGKRKLFHDIKIEGFLLLTRFQKMLEYFKELNEYSVCFLSSSVF